MYDQKLLFTGEVQNMISTVQNTCKNLNIKVNVDDASPIFQ